MASSPLFDAPFAASINQRRNYNYSERTPFRDNDSFSVAEMPRFAQSHRRKSPRPIQFAMKCILLSPVAVLILWSGIVWSKSSNSRIQASPARGQELPQQLYSELAPAMTVPRDGKIIPVIAPLGASGNEATIVRPRPKPAPRAAEQVQDGLLTLIVQPPLQPPELVSSSLTQAQPIQNEPTLRAALQNEPNMMISLQNEPNMMAALQNEPNLMATSQHEPNYMDAQPPIQNQPGLAQGYSVLTPTVPTPVSGASKSFQGSNHLRGNSVKYYYYNPSDLKQDNAGNLVLPLVVYDTNGRPTFLSALSSVKSLVLEPPKGIYHHNVTTNATDTNTTYLHPTVVHTPVMDNHRKIAWTGSSAAATASDVWGKDPATDQSIIVATVAVMALLVGALSARKIRTRSALAACIENESLQDDVAYDTAYTVPTDSYNTFTQWKGDLEKFDV